MKYPTQSDSCLVITGGITYLWAVLKGDTNSKSISAIEIFDATLEVAYS
jgi:hypothetical protein